MQRLSGPSREVLGLAAVVGRDVDVDLLAALTGANEPVMTAIEEAVADAVVGALEDR